MKIIKSVGIIDMLGTMYPSKAQKMTDGLVYTIPYSTMYGYVFEGTVTLPNGWEAKAGEYFSYSSTSEEEVWVENTGTAVFFTRLGHIHQNNLGGPIEDTGRLCYIDGCSDSLLIYPSRLGDPSMNLLYFPPGIDQSFHIHPSVRLGCVASGSGRASLKDEVIDLKAGDLFCIEEREYNRFTTQNESMRVIAYHPDGDWGPTDDNHTMLNRTYLTDRK